MAKKGKGWIKLYRQITDTFIWNTDEPFDRRSAWVDLLLMANHEERSFMLRNGNTQIVLAGQLFTSIVHLSKRWKWSRNRVYRYLEQLTEQGMCTVSGTPNGTLITLIKYGDFQGERTASGTTDGTTDGTRTRMYNKNVYNKNVKQEKAQAPDSSPWGGTRE